MSATCGVCKRVVDEELQLTTGGDLACRQCRANAQIYEGERRAFASASGIDDFICKHCGHQIGRFIEKGRFGLTYEQFGFIFGGRDAFGQRRDMRTLICAACGREAGVSRVEKVALAVALVPFALLLLYALVRLLM